MRTTAIVAALLLNAIACRADNLAVGGFAVGWEAGWSLVSEDPVRYAGPGPTGVTIDLLDHGEISAAQMEAEKEKWASYATEEAPKVVARHGEVVIPLKREDLPSGYTLFSVASAGKKNGRDYFGFLFVSISPEGRLAQFAVEGFGDAKTRFPLFHDFMTGGMWKKEHNSERSNQAPLPTTTAVTPAAEHPPHQP